MAATAVIVVAPALVGAAGTAQATGTAVALGSAATYSVLAGDSVSNGGATLVSGDLGTSPTSSISGFPPGTIDGNQHAGDSAAQQATTDFHAAYHDAATRATTGSLASELNGATFGPGVYAAAAGLTVTGTMTLDAKGDADAVFIFQVGGGLNTAASSVIALTNGAQANNVFWQVHGALVTGASATFVGTVLAQGGITLGEQTTLTGRALSEGVVTLSDNPIAFTDAIRPKIDIKGGPTAVSTSPQAVIAGTSDAPAGTPVSVKVAGRAFATTVRSDGTWTLTTPSLAGGTYPVSASVKVASGAIGTANQSLTIRTGMALVALGSSATFSVLAAGTATSTEKTVLSGDLGTSPSAAVVGFPPGVVNGSIHAGDPVSAQALTDAKAGYQDALSRTRTGTFAGDQIGHTFTPGVYYSEAAFALTGALTLDGGGDPNSVFIFQINAAMNAGAGANITLTNGAVAAHVFWQVNGAVTTGSGSVVEGTFLANGDITVGAGNTIFGRLLAITGGVIMDGNQITTAAAGFLSISAPTDVFDLGSQRNTSAGSTFSGVLGTVTVTDQRGSGDSGWSATVSSTDFTAPSGATIPATDVGYNPGAITTTGTVTTVGTLSTNLSSSVSVVTASQISGNNTALWNPTLTVSVPGGAVAGTYAATITHSVL